MTHQRPARFSTPRRQRGAALLTAMIIVTLVATLAAAMVWQQWRSVQVEAAERARAQSAWILMGALDFAGLILREDFKGGRFTALTEPWATPLAESRLSTFLAADKSNNADDGPEAFLSGNITDAQARYNLRNLVGVDFKIVPTELATLQRLCVTLGLDASLAPSIASRLRDALATSSTSGPANAPLLPETVAQLSWFGLDPAALQTLAPYVVVLPVATGVNVNTASKEVLAATIEGLDAGTAERLVQLRQRTPFKTIGDFTAQLSSALAAQVTQSSTATLTYRSDFFEVQGRLRLADHVLVERSLVQRSNTGIVTVLHSERVASLEQLGS